MVLHRKNTEIRNSNKDSFSVKICPYFFTNLWYYESIPNEENF